MPLHHLGGVILNTSAVYTHTETTCWFGWLSGKTNGSKTMQSVWKNSQVCLVLLLKSFPSAGSWRCNSYAQTMPQVLNSSHENLFLHYSPLSVYCSSSKYQHHLQTSFVATWSLIPVTVSQPFGAHKPLKSSQLTHPLRLFFRGVGTNGYKSQSGP